VRWQDGVPFTSRDVAFSFHAVLNPKIDVVNRYGFEDITRVATPDPYTVVVTLRRPYAPAVTTFFGDGSQYAIVPAHLLERERDINRAAFNALPVGTGPYRIVRWLRGQEIDLEANPAYYLKKPAIQKITIRFVPDEATDVNLLRTHEIDLYTLASVGAYGQLRGLPGVAVALTPIHGATTMLFNNTRPELRDPRVRRAIALAIDKRALVDKLTFGAASVASADLPDFMWAHDPATRPIPYDPQAAKRLLQAAGGRPLAFVLAYDVTSATARAASVQVQAYLQAVGIDVQLKGYSAQQLFAGYGAGGIYQNGTFDLAWYTMTLGIDPDSAGRFSCDAVPPNGQNYSRYCNRDVDRAERDGLRVFDRGGRKRAYSVVQRRLLADVPVLFAFYPKNVDAYNSDLRGFHPNPVTASWNAQDWSFR
jgi:peptide/nickel transport system substrate-binding protein